MTPTYEFVISLPMTIDIKRAREALGLTQEAFADRLGLDQSTISLWETGRAPRRIALLAVEALLRSEKLDPALFRKEGQGVIAE